MKPPAAGPNEINLLVDSYKIDRDKYPVIIVGVRGYSLEMGQARVNDRGIYDDAAFVLSPTAFLAVNFNTDPSGYRKGKGTGAGKGMAVLDPGLWMYRVGPHRGVSPALRQADKVTVTRDGDPPYKETGIFAINHHRGGARTTSSAGCQTVPPSQWKNYIQTIVSELNRYGQGVVPYLLINEADFGKFWNPPARS